MLEIAFVACAIVTNAQGVNECKNYSLTYMEEASVSPMLCAFRGQVEIAKWTEEHPNWRVTKWSCHTARQKSKA